MNNNNPRCRSCKERFNKTDLSNPYCSKSECQQIRTEILIEKQYKKAIANLNKIKKDKKKASKEKLKTKSDYEKELQTPINKIARLIDKGSTCMMCKCNMKRTNGCHHHSVGSNPTLRFNLFNIWIGCHSCNSEKGGNINGYDSVLIELYGREKWEYIKFDIIRETQPLHLAIEDLKQAKIIANRIVRELTKINKEYTPIERWELRQKYNLQIGIYH